MEKREKWEHFSHDADIGVRGYGSTVSLAFAMGATALTAVMCDLKNVNAIKSINIVCNAQDLEILFVDWLNAIIYEMDIHDMIFSNFKVDINIQNIELKAIIMGEPIDQLKHQPAVGIKGATYTELKVYEDNGLWIAQCVLDV